MVTSQRDLVRAVLADPDADAPRRAYAAWAKARPFPDGDPARGELVDVQLELAAAHREHLASAAWLPFYGIDRGDRSPQEATALRSTWRASCVAGRSDREMLEVHTLDDGHRVRAEPFAAIELDLSALWVR